MQNNGFILIVEDSMTQARHLESILKPLGYDVSTVGDGKVALDFLRKQKALIVIADILMPMMDGYELCRHIKSDTILKEVPVVLLTQLSDPKEIIRGLECGADDFIVKPYNEDLLLARIQDILAARVGSTVDNKQRCILIVEDSPTQVECLKYLLEDKGYQVMVANNGREGLEVAQKIMPTLIISDILMPVMDGYELAYEIKRNERLRKIPIIFITSLMDRRDVANKAAIVADGYFTKPYDDSYLLNKVETLISMAGREEEKGEKGLEVTFAGERYVIASGRRQILNILLSTYESAVRQNRDLVLMQRELQAINEQLEERVTERTRQLQASETKYRMLLESNADAIVVIGRDRMVYFANKAAEALLGLKSEELVGRMFFIVVTPGKTEDVEINRNGGGKIIAEMRVVKTTWEEKKASIATFRDVTERKQMEEALRESSENFMALAENANDGIVITGITGDIVYANRLVAEMTGHTLEELLKINIKDTITPDKFSEITNLYKQMLEGMPYRLQYETVILQKNGRQVPVEITASKTIWRGQAAAIVIVRDIKEKKKREEEILRSSKFESIGVLAGGIAHDFNNLLTGILGNISLAKINMKAEDRIYTVLDDLEKASFKAKDLTHQLLTFAKGGVPVKKTASIVDLIKESADFVLRGSKVKCAFSFAPNILPVEIDTGQMNQVIHNLIINAEQAMPDGGIIKLSAANVTVDAESDVPIMQGKYIKITVADTGGGIPEQHLTKIFDPYFTTKEGGSGLGLAVVYSVIKKHAGYLSVESKVGVGTTFYIYLPASCKEIIPTKVIDNKPIFGKGRILIMDDEELIRDVCGRMLAKLGYDVDYASNGEEAIDLYKKEKDAGRPFNAIIMDLTIPGGMGGKDAIKKLHEIDPQVKAIVSSGYSEDAAMSNFVNWGFKAVIAKPYRITDLSETVHQVLSE
ncbi:MAG: response regulator [Planctomycetes bacterium]|nr:response regulator [Planctomycetota bacterium]